MAASRKTRHVNKLQLGRVINSTLRVETSENLEVVTCTRRDHTTADSVRTFYRRP